MSFLTEAAARRVMTFSVPRGVVTGVTNSAPRAASAAFSTSATFQKSPVQAAKETLKSVDRKVSDKLVEGLDMGG